MRFKGKKAQNLPTSTIIILVLGLVVLALLILYFTGGMKSLWREIQLRAGIVSGSEGDAKSLCDAMCNLGNKDVCPGLPTTKEFTFYSGDKKITKTCAVLGATCPEICT